MPTDAFQPQDPHYEQRVRGSFERQAAMKTIGAYITAIDPGRVVIELPYSAALTQQHGFMHAGMIAAALDSACGYAAFSLMPHDAAVLTIEYKINLVAPGRGQLFRMEGVVIKPGRTITVVEGRAYAVDDGKDKLIATMTATEMTIVGRDDVKH
ncbi:MAG TPA: PaaI family thioesterase [Ramlibacter sp.]|nr:PaaI family thioesterase [Ramlibacter sp.]